MNALTLYDTHTITTHYRNGAAYTVAARGNCYTVRGVTFYTYAAAAKAAAACSRSLTKGGGRRD